MRIRLMALAIVAGAILIPAGAALALIAIIPLGPAQITTADAVLVGKVTEIEPADVDAKPFPGSKETVKYKVAIVKIEQAIHGVKDVKSVRVGFPAPVAPQPGKPIIGGGRRGPQLTVGQEGLFVMSMHGDGKFYQAPNFGAFVSKADGKKFDSDVAMAKRVVTVASNARQSLESKDSDERMMAAQILVTKYRTQKAPFPNKQEPIDAAESKLLLNVIANAEWKQTRFGEANPYQLFLQLGITDKDGWKAPVRVKSQDEIRDAVREWIKSNGDKYRIQRFVQGETK